LWRQRWPPLVLGVCEKNRCVVDERMGWLEKLRDRIIINCKDASSSSRRKPKRRLKLKTCLVCVHMLRLLQCARASRACARRLSSASAPAPPRGASSTTIPVRDASGNAAPVKSVTGKLRGAATDGTDLAVKFWMTAASLDYFLRADQKSSFLGLEFVHTICASQLAANDPLEDRFAVVREPHGDRIVLMVADGHGGSQVGNHARLIRFRGFLFNAPFESAFVL
jgi:hypothetical protein